MTKQCNCPDCNLAREQEQKRIIEMFENMYEKKKVALKNLGLPLDDWWGESEIFSLNELQDLEKQIQEEKK